MTKNMILKTWQFPIFILVIVLIQTVLMVHGFDVCDEGFSLTFYQQFFSHPESVEYCFVYWLSGLVGGLWYQLFESGGILWFRFLTVIFNTATLLLCYHILKAYVNKYQVLLGLTMVLFINDFGFLAFYHNHLTAFLAVLSVFYLVRGLQHEKQWLIGLSGLILGINIFSRLPNVTLLIFVLAIPYTTFVLRKQPLITSIKPFVFMVFGTILGVLLTIGLMFSLNQWDIMENAFEVLFSLGKTDDSGHNFMTLIRVIKNNYVAIVYETFKLGIVLILIGLLNKMLKRYSFGKLVSSCFALILFFVLFVKGDIYIVYVLGFIGCFGVLLTRQKTETIKIIAFLAVLIMLFLPLGSGGGVHSSGYICIWLALPFFFHFTSQILNIKIVTELELTRIKFFVNGQVAKPMLAILAISFFVYKGYSISQEAYFDNGNRLSKTSKIQNKYARGIYTTSERAKIINDALTELENHVRPDDYLLMYDSSPMLHFLTETRPYAYNPWIWVYDHVSFEQKISTAEKQIKVLPVVVQQKFTTIRAFSDPMDDYLAENKEQSNTYHSGRAAVMNDFLKRHDYKIIWSNAYFNIYRPNLTSKTK